MKRYANDKYYYWRDELTNPKPVANKKDEKDERKFLHWIFPLIR